MAVLVKCGQGKHVPPRADVMRLGVQERLKGRKELESSSKWSSEKKNLTMGRDSSSVKSACLACWKPWV